MLLIWIWLWFRFVIVCRSCSGCGKVLEYDLYSDEPTFVKNAAGQVLGFSSSASGFSLWFCLYLTPIASYYWLYILFNGFWLCVCRANWLEEMYVAFRVMTQLPVRGYSRMVWFVKPFLFKGWLFRCLFCWSFPNPPCTISLWFLGDINTLWWISSTFQVLFKIKKESFLFLGFKEMLTSAWWADS